MKSKLNLMTVLVGLAMLATPITAAAKDHDHGGGKNFSRPAQARAFNAPARHFAPARVAPAFVTNHPFRNRAVFVPAPVVVANPHWKADRKEWKHGPDGDGDADDYAAYGRGGNYAGPGYYGAPAYAGYAGNKSCARARHIVTVYRQDRYSGHPAAAASLLRNNQWAFRSGCGSAAAMGGGGLFNGLGGLGNGYGAAPVYNNYGAGYGQPYAGYNGGYGQPYGGGYGGYNGYNGYNGGYGQPNGGGAALLAPLLQQFVH